MADLASDLYTKSFIADNPKATQALLENRLKHVGTVAGSLSAYFKERSACELDYTKRLQKLASKPIIGSQRSADDGLDKLLSQLEVELADIIRIHEQAAKRFETQIADGLRESTISDLGEGAIAEAESQVSGPIREYEEAAHKLSKSGSSLLGKKQNHGAPPAEELATAHAIWSTTAPQYLSAIQSAEQRRWQAVKENIANYATMTSDLGRQLMQLAENTLVTAVSWEPEDDMQTFCLKTGGKTASGAAPSEAISARAASRSGRGPAPAVPARRNTQSTALPPAIVEPSPSIHSGMSSHADDSGKKEKKGFLSAFSKKVKGKPSLNRNRSSSKPDQYSSIGNADNGPINARSAPPPVAETRNSVDDRYSLNDEAGALNGAAPIQGRQNLSPADSSLNTKAKRDSILPNIMRRKNSVARSNSSLGQETPAQPMVQVNEAPTPLSDTFSTDSNAQVDSPTEELAMPTLQPSNARPQPVSQVSDASSYGSRNPFGAMTPPIQPETRNLANGLGQSSAAYDGQPIQSSSSFGGLERETSPSQFDSGPSESPVARESAEERAAALRKVQNTLLAAGPSAAGNVNRRSTVARGRRSTFSPISDDPPSSQAQAETLSSVSPNPPATAANGRAGSILSSVSSHDNLAAAASSPFSNPTGSGLRAAIIETVNVLSKSDQPVRVMITGEVVLQLRDTPSAGHVSLRFSSTDNIEKIAPNNQFLNALAPNNGEYQLDTASLSQASSRGGTVTVLKYHVVIGNAADFVPITLTPVWKCEAQQTSILVSYSTNASSRLATATSSGASPFDSDAETPTLKDVSFAVPVYSSGVSNVQSKPTAEYDSERKRLTWNVPDLSLPNGATQKALARFAVDSVTQPGPVSVRWRLPGRLVSGISLEIGSTSGEVTYFAELACQTIAGKYLVA